MSNSEQYSSLPLWVISISFLVAMVGVLSFVVSGDKQEDDTDYTSDVAAWTQDVADHSKPSELRNTFIGNVTRFSEDGSISHDEYVAIAYDYQLLKEAENITSITNSLMKIRARDGLPLLLSTDIAVDLPLEGHSDPSDNRESVNYDNNDQARTTLNEKQ